MCHSYTGRFAPTPSGHLHLGSVIAALGSYLAAKSSNGTYLVRIEDLDRPRCLQSSTDSILNALKVLSLTSDKEILIQSHNTEIYYKACQDLLNKNLAFYCSCSRANLKERPCTCYKKDLDSSKGLSLRFYHRDLIKDSFTDRLKGRIYIPVNKDSFIALIRADGIFSYNLACVVDDIRQGVTHIVRGSDLIDMSPVQNALYNAFGHTLPEYMHLPLALSENGLKISKQNHAADILSLIGPQASLKLALSCLGQRYDYIKEDMSCADILKAALEYFEVDKIPVHDIVINDISLY